MFSKTQLIEVIRKKDLSESGLIKLLNERNFLEEEIIEILIESLKNNYFELAQILLNKSEKILVDYPLQLQTIKKLTFGQKYFMDKLNELSTNVSFDNITLSTKQLEDLNEFLEVTNLNLRLSNLLLKSKNINSFYSKLDFLEKVDFESSDSFSKFLNSYLEIHQGSLNKYKKEIINKIKKEGGEYEEVLNMPKPIITLKERMDGSLDVENKKEVFLYEHKLELLQTENLIYSPYFLYANKEKEDFFIGKHYYKDAIISYTNPIASYIRYSEDKEFKYADLKITNGEFEQIYIRSDIEQKNYIELDKELEDSYLEKQGIEKKVSGLAEISNLLSGNQDLIFRSPTNGIVVVEGVSGSGKTNLIFHRIDYLLQEFPDKFRKDKIAIFVKNGYLRAYMKNTLINTEFIFKDFIEINLIYDYLIETLKRNSNLYDWPILNKQDKKLSWKENINELIVKFLDVYSENLRTFIDSGKFNIDKILNYWYEMLGEQFHDLYLNYDELILIAYICNELNNKLYSTPLFEYDYVLVDEFQDFTFVELSFLAKSFGKSLVFSGDFTQSVIHGPEVLQKLGIEIKGNKRMTDNFRNSYEIVKFANNVFSEEEKSKLLLAKRVIRRGDLPTIFKSDNIDFIAEKLKELIEKSISESKKLAVIYHDFKFAKQVYEKLETHSKGMFPNYEKVNLDEFYNSQIYFLSYWDCKGLEFDNVVLIDPENLLKDVSLESKKLFYIGCTRAVFNLYLFNNNIQCK